MVAKKIMTVLTILQLKCMNCLGFSYTHGRWKWIEGYHWENGREFAK